MPYVFIVVAIVTGSVFYRLAEYEQRPGWVWAASSVAFAILAYWVLGWGYIGIACFQVILFVVMLVDNIRRPRNIE